MYGATRKFFYPNKTFDWGELRTLIWKDMLYAVIPLIVVGIIYSVIQLDPSGWFHSMLLAPEVSFASIILYSLAAKRSEKSDNTEAGLLNRISCSEAFVSLLIISVVALTMVMVAEKVPKASKAKFSVNHLGIFQWVLFIWAIFSIVRLECWKRKNSLMP